MTHASTRAPCHQTSVWSSGTPRAPCSSLRDLIRRHEAEPQKVVRTEGEQVWQLADGRKRGLTPQLERYPAVELVEIELHKLRKARQVVHAENHFVAIPPQKDQHAAVVGIQRLEGTAPERAELLPNAHEPSRPQQE